MKAARNNLGNAFCPVCDTPLRNLRDREESTVSMDDDEDDVSSIVRGLNGACDPIGRREFRKFQALQDQSKAGNEQIIHDAYGRALGNDLLNRQPSLKKSHTMFLRASDKKFPEPMVPSAKTTMVKSTILQWQAEAPDDKIIIFTQFLEESQILGRMLQTENISFLYFWGELNQKQKQKTLETFRENRDVKVLVSVYAQDLKQSS